MDAKAEQLDLKAHPLPEIAILNPLTFVWTLDAEIEALSEHLADLREQRKTALEYAVRHNIDEDDKCRIEEKRRRSRTLNLEKFRAVFPEEYLMCCDIERKEKLEALEHIGEKVNLTLVDKLVKPIALEAAPGVVSVSETITFQVIHK